jgi:hypothetical protein
MYTIALADQATKEYARKDKAIEFANKVARRDAVELEVVDSETNAVVHVATPVEGRQFHPWERVETPKFQSPHFEGWRPAYTRSRIQATVYRSYDEEAELKWLVHDGRTGGKLEVATTKAARLLTTEMRHGRTL